MKKTKFIAMTLAASIMMMGAGYAYWSETLTIENTITTGELDFTFQKAELMSVSKWMDYDGESSIEVDASDDNKVNIVLEDMYPGAEATVYFEVLNSGTMKAKLKNFEVSEFDQKEFFNVTLLEVDGINIEPVTLGKLNNLNMEIEPGQEKTFKATLQIDPSASEDDIAENLGQNNDAIEFSITAAGLQYNDDIN